MSFIVVVPTPAEKMDFLARHGTIHSSQIITNPDLYREAWREACPHTKTYIDNGIKYCKLCDKSLEVLSYRD